MKTLKIVGRLLLYVRPYSGKLVLLVMLSLFGVIMMVLKPLPVKYIIDNVLLRKELPAGIHDFLVRQGWGTGVYDILYLNLALMAMVILGGIVISYASFFLSNQIGIRLVYDLSVDLYRKFQSLSLSFYARNKIGDLLQRFNGDVFAVYLLVAQIILPIMTSILTLTGMYVVMHWIDPALALIAISVVPVLVLLLAVVSNPMYRTTMSQYDKQGELSAFVQQSLVSMRVIQAFVRENYMLEKLMSKALTYKKAYIKANLISEGYNQTANIITGIATVVLVGIGAHKGIEGKISPGDLYVFLGYIIALYGPVNSLATAAGVIITFGARGRRVYEILDAEDEVKESPHAVELKNVKGQVEFRDVDFGYHRDLPGEVKVLQGIRFKVEPGKVTAIIGSTGAGKTSLISLLGRFHDPWQGSIWVDGYDIREVKVKSLREHISMVLQDPILFPVSIAENIAFGNPEASMDQIMEAARRSEAHDFIMSFPMGYETVISEAGLSLSGGEKQRLSLARAFLMDTPIIVLDEPTSSVDGITEARIFARLKEHNRNKTVFVISHRLSTIKNADQIIVLEHGMIAERGTHQELIQGNNLYAKLYSSQAIS